MLRKLNSAVALVVIAFAILATPALRTTAIAQDRSAAKIAGSVVDNYGQRVAKVSISLDGKLLGESGIDGTFSVTLPRNESRVALTFAAQGYVSNTRVYDAKAAVTGNVVVIWPIAYRVSFDASRELDVELGSSRIKIPANALTSPGGQKPSGPVVLQFTLLDITDRSQRAAASGDFSGRMTDGSIRRLNSFGIFDFDLQDTRGRRLTLTPGTRIELSIPVPPKLASLATKQVGFFNFDVRSGRWIQIGNFEFAQSTLTYNGSVTSFGGAHNLDIDQDTTCITVQIVNIFDASGMPNFSVTAHGPQYSSSGTTNSSGFVCLLVQRNSTFTVDAYGTVGSSFWLTPTAVTFASPNFSSGAADCGNSCTTCPFLGTVPVDLVVGTGGIHRQPLGTQK